MRNVQIGFLGLGNIGCGVWTLLSTFAADIAHRDGLTITVKRVLVRDVDKPRPASVPRELLTTDPDDVLRDPEITLVVECMGGEEPATAYIARALESGKTVVTANKMAMALNWHVMHAAAKKGGAGLYFEASVCGALPVVRTLTDSLQANHIGVLMGIINGTTNYILTRMTEQGEDYAAVLKDAQALGLAEPDPTSDVEGYDAAYKLSILSSLAFHARIPVACVYREGIAGVDARDIAYGRDMGYTLKLLAIAKREGSTVEARVHPAFIPTGHPLSSVSGALNAVYLEGHACKEMMLMGHGAGSMPTASAIVSDLLYALLHEKPVHPSFQIGDTLSEEITVADDWRSRYYVRLSAADEPGVLSHITSAFGENGVSIFSLVQRGAETPGCVPIVLVTHMAWESRVKRALAAISPSFAQVRSMLRVEG